MSELKTYKVIPTLTIEAIYCPKAGLYYAGDVKVEVPQDDMYIVEAQDGTPEAQPGVLFRSNFEDPDYEAQKRQEASSEEPAP
jgi:hypothetical protein